MKGIIFENPIFICAGESSGDLYAGCLAGQLKDNVPRPVIYGVGGEEMKKNGVEVLIDYQGLMTFGFSSGFFSFLRNCLVYKEIRKKLFQMRPKTFIAVAYPGINILLCRSAKKLGCRVYYFLPPQIWAWGGFRKYFIKKWVDTVISVFPFEYKFYKKTGIETRFWENPLWKKLTGYKRTDFRKRIGFMPGSRSSEIKRNMPVVLDLMDKIRQKNRDAEFCLVMHEDFISKAWHSNLKTITQNRHQAMKNCDLLVTCSGTASLEAAIMDVPQIFFNRPSFIDYHLFRRFLKIGEYNLVNLYFGRRMVPSYVSRNESSLIKEILGQLPGSIVDL